MERVELTEEQAAPIEVLRGRGYSNRQIISNVVPELNSFGIQIIDLALESIYEEFITWHDEDFDRLIKALYVGYDIVK